MNINHENDMNDNPKANGRLHQARQRTRIARDYALIIMGSLLLALSMHLFFIPHQLVAGGLSGTAQIINKFTGWPIGMLSFVLNIWAAIAFWRARSWPHLSSRPRSMGCNISGQMPI